MAVTSAVVPTYVPRLATGVELIGRFEDSGFKNPPFLARRKDGQVVQLAPVLYALAEEIDGRRDTAEIAVALSHRIQRGVDAGMVETLLEEQLCRLGLVAERNGVTAEVVKLDPLLALKFRARVVPAGVVRALTTVFRPLFAPPVMVAVVTGLLALDVWLFGFHGISQGVRHVLYQPALLFALLGCVIAATAFHELGHATAVRYGGAEPGVMGVGVYIVWPAFYTDITDAYRLGKWGRLRADVGGMYFNAIVALVAAGAYAATGFEPLLLVVLLQNFAIVQQSLPFLRLDGYYIVSDLTGVPDILARIRPVLASLLPWREPGPRVAELKPWVRFVVTAYVVTIVPLIALLFAVMLVHAPRLFATAWDSLALRYDRLGGEPAGAVAQDVLQMIVLTLPCLGMVYTTARVSSRTGRGAWRWSAGSALRRVPLLAGVAGAVAVLALLWWPRGDYRPIQPGERGTLIGALRNLEQVPSGRAALTVQRELQLGGAPTERLRQTILHGPLPARARELRAMRGRLLTGRRGEQQTLVTGTWNDPVFAPETPPDPPPAGSTQQTTTTVQPIPQPEPAPAPSEQPSSTQSQPPPSDTSTTTTDTTPSDTSTTDTTPTQTTTTETTPTTTETTPTDTTTTETTPTQTTTTETTPTQTTTTPGP